MNNARNINVILIYLLSPVFLILTHFSSMAQIEEKLEDKVNQYGILYYQPRGLEGSPFLMNDWRTGSIQLYNGQEAKNVLLKFDIITNELIFYNDKFKNMFIADRYTVTSFVLNTNQKDSMIFIKYSGDNLGYRLKRNDFVHQLHNGKLKLLAKYSADITEANDLNSKDKVYQKNYFFLQKEDQITEIKLNLNSVIKIFPERKHELKKMANQLHFKPKSVEEMVKLLQQFDLSL